MMYLHLSSLKTKFGNKMQNPRSAEMDPKKSELEILQISEIIGIFVGPFFISFFFLTQVLGGLKCFPLIQTAASVTASFWKSGDQDK